MCSCMHTNNRGNWKCKPACNLTPVLCLLAPKAPMQGM